MTIRTMLGRVLLPASIAILTGCLQQDYSLPADWPIPQLTLPPGARLTSPAQVGSKAPGGGTYKTNSYAHFTMGSPWTAAARHVEQCLAPLGYAEHVSIYADGSSSQDQARDYWSTDAKTEVELTPLLAGQTPVVILRVTEYQEPQPVPDSQGSETGKVARTEIRPL
jgi:hypothetical protein